MKLKDIPEGRPYIIGNHNNTFTLTERFNLRMTVNHKIIALDYNYNWRVSDHKELGCKLLRIK